MADNGVTGCPSAREGSEKTEPVEAFIPWTGSTYSPARCGDPATWENASRLRVVLIGGRGSPPSRLGAVLALRFAVGYLLADWWPRARDTSPLAKIRARVDDANSLEENLKGQTSDELRAELQASAE